MVSVRRRVSFSPRACARRQRLHMRPSVRARGAARAPRARARANTATPLVTHARACRNRSKYKFAINTPHGTFVYVGKQLNKKKCQKKCKKKKLKEKCKKTCCDAGF